MQNGHRIGLVGIGLLGSALAERLLANRRKVCGFDSNPVALQAFQAQGGEILNFAALVQTCETIVLCLPGSPQVETCVREMIEIAPPPRILIDTTTGSPDASVNFSMRLSEAGHSYCDSTIGGSSKQVRLGESIVLCGASKDLFDRVRAILSCFGGLIYHTGPVGSAARMKLAINLVIGLHRVVLAEGLEFARSMGIDPGTALEILKASPAYSRAMDIKGRKMIDENFEPEARLSQHLKDVRLILESGQTNRARLPLSQLHRDLLEEAELQGWGDSDNSAIIKIFQRANQ